MRPRVLESLSNTKRAAIGALIAAVVFVLLSAAWDVVFGGSSSWFDYLSRGTVFGLGLFGYIRWLDRKAARPPAPPVA